MTMNKSMVSRPSPYAKKAIALSMFEKGKAFIGAALLLQQHEANPYVVLHLLCQGIELLGKGYLLSLNYETYISKLRQEYGHNLLKLTTAVETESKLKLLRPAVRVELAELSNLYKRQLLRYGSGFDLLRDAKTIPSIKVWVKLTALFRLAQRHGFPDGPRAN